MKEVDRNRINEIREQFEADRQKIFASRDQFLVTQVIPSALAVLFSYALLAMPFFALMTLFTLIARGLHIWNKNISIPTQSAKMRMREGLLDLFITTNYPDISCRYVSNSHMAAGDMQQADLFDHNPSFVEEDAIKGQIGKKRFYLSEIVMDKNDHEERLIAGFKGFFMKFRIPGLRMPKSQLYTRPGLLKSFALSKTDGYSFFIQSADKAIFYKKAKHMFPFIQHLMHRSGDVRIDFNGDEISMFIQSDMRFMDSGDQKLRDEPLSLAYRMAFARQLHAIFFIVRAFCAFDEHGTLASLAIEELEVMRRHQ